MSSLSNIALLLLTVFLAVRGDQLSSPLFGIVVIGQNGRTEGDFMGANIHQDGNVSYTARIFRGLGQTVTIDGVSTLSEKTQVMYFAMDSDSTYVFAYNARTGAVLPVVDISALFIESLESSGGYVYVQAVIDSEPPYNAIVGFAEDDVLAPMYFNLTEKGITTLGRTTIDQDTGTMYLVSSIDDTYTKFMLSSFNLSDPDKSFTSKPVTGCSGLSITKIFYDYQRDQVFGLAVQQGISAWSQLSIDPSTGACKANSLPGINNGTFIVCSAFDHKNRLLFLHVKSAIHEYDLSSGKGIFVNTTAEITNLAVPTTNK